MRYFVEYRTIEDGWMRSYGTMGNGPILQRDGFTCKVGASTEAQRRKQWTGEHYPELRYRYRVVDLDGNVVMEAE